MFNPLLDDPRKLKDKDLEDKILGLTQKYHIAMRLGQGGLAQQIILNLDTYKIELQGRQQELVKEIQEKQKKQGLDDLINVD